MLFKSYIDFDPVCDYQGFTLGRFSHDDSDGFGKYDYDVYQIAEHITYDDGPEIETYFHIKSLDISPYEKSVETIRKAFENYIDDFLKLNHGLEKSL